MKALLAFEGSRNTLCVPRSASRDFNNRSRNQSSQSNGQQTETENTLIATEGRMVRWMDGWIMPVERSELTILACKMVVLPLQGHGQGQEELPDLLELAFHPLSHDFIALDRPV